MSHRTLPHVRLELIVKRAPHSRTDKSIDQLMRVESAELSSGPPSLSDIAAPLVYFDIDLPQNQSSSDPTYYNLQVTIQIANDSSSDLVWLQALLARQNQCPIEEPGCMAGVDSNQVR